MDSYRTRRTAWTLWVALLVAGAAHLAFPDRATHRYQAGFLAFNADSPAFARTVVRFPRGFIDCEQGRARLSRPLYSLLGWMIFKPLQPLARFVPVKIGAHVSEVMARANHPEIWTGIDPRELVLAWGALVLVNLALYLVALLLIHDALGRWFSPDLALALCLLTAWHPNTIDFVLIPHSEVFNVLIPALFLHALFRRWPEGDRWPGGALLLGICMLGKGLAFPFVNWLLEIARRPQPIRNLAAAITLFSTPFLLYRAALAYLRIPWFSAETETYRQFVWIVDDASSGNWAHIPLRIVGSGVEYALASVQVLAVPLVATIALALAGRRRPDTDATGTPAVTFHLVAYTIACLFFWAFSGLVAPRLSICLVPPMAVALGQAAASRWRSPARGVTVIATLWLVTSSLFR